MQGIPMPGNSWKSHPETRFDSVNDTNPGGNDVNKSCELGVTFEKTDKQ